VWEEISQTTSKSTLRDHPAHTTAHLPLADHTRHEGVWLEGKCCLQCWRWMQCSSHSSAVCRTRGQAFLQLATEPCIDDETTEAVVEHVQANEIMAQYSHTWAYSLNYTTDEAAADLCVLFLRRTSCPTSCAHGCFDDIGWQPRNYFMLLGRSHIVLGQQLWWPQRGGCGLHVLVFRGDNPQGAQHFSERKSCLELHRLPGSFFSVYFMAGRTHSHELQMLLRSGCCKLGWTRQTLARSPPTWQFVFFDSFRREALWLMTCKTTLCGSSTLCLYKASSARTIAR